MTQEKLCLALAQVNIVWEDPGANRINYDRLFNESLKDADIIILPEMFNTGFTMHSSDLAESMDGKTISWMKEKSLLF
jgi:omega-amidase